MGQRPLTVTDLVDGHVVLDLECFDRIYLTGWLPTLQVRAQAGGDAPVSGWAGPRGPQRGGRDRGALEFQRLGPAFAKVCAYFLHPVKIWLNGHEDAKCAAVAAGIGFTELGNGFATASDPAGRQRLCDTLARAPSTGFCER